MLGPVSVRGRVTGHLFGGAAFRADYVELGGSAAYTLGPVQFDAGADYAPRQAAIGGDDLYLHAGAQAGIPGTPWTLLAGIGHSTGRTDDPFRAARLRPAGDYSGWRNGVLRNTGPVTQGLDYAVVSVAGVGVLGPQLDLSGDYAVRLLRISMTSETSRECF